MGEEEGEEEGEWLVGVGFCASVLYGGVYLSTSGFIAYFFAVTAIPLLLPLPN